MDSSTRRRARDRFAASGVREDVATDLARIAHPFDGESLSPTDDVRRAVSSEAAAFQTAAGATSDGEELLWLGYTVARRMASTAEAGADAAVADHLAAIAERIDAVIHGRDPLIPPLGALAPSAVDLGSLPPPSAPSQVGWAAPSGDQASWPSAHTEAAWPAGVAPAPSSRRTGVIVASVMGVLVLVVIGLGVIGSLVASTDLGVDTGEATMAPFPEGGFEDPFVPGPPVFDALPELERAGSAPFGAVLDEIARSEQIMGDYQRSVAVAADDVELTDAERLEAFADAGATNAKRLRDVIERIDGLAFGDDAGDLPIVVISYLEHQQAWIAVMQGVAGDPELAVSRPDDLFDDVNSTANDFAPKLAAVRPIAMAPGQEEVLFLVLSGFGNVDLEAIFGGADPVV